MDEKTIKMLLALLRSTVCGKPLTEEERQLYAQVQLQNILQIAAKHDVSHLLALALKQNGLITKENAGIEQHIFKAAFRYEGLRYEYENLCAALEKAQIPFIPLKGSVLRDYYPEPWMRTSCDIDVLVHSEDISKAIAYLTEHLEYTYKGRGSHDVSLYSTGGIHIELHYDLVEEGRANNAIDISRLVWENVVLHENSLYWYEMTDAFFYFYHIAHMAKHFETGGCGVRPFIDLWILDNMENADHAGREALLVKADLLRFADTSRSLSKVWLEGKEPDELSMQMQAFLLQGGVYGTKENRILLQQQKKGGRLKYALSKIFIPYDVIKFHYPILQKYRLLTPFMQVRRWFKLAFCGHAKRTLRELTYNACVSKSQAEEMKFFLNEIGL